MADDQEKQNILQKYYFLNQEIDRKISEWREWNDRIYQITSCCCMTPGAEEKNKLMKIAAKQINCLGDEIDHEMFELVRLREKIQKMIQSVSDDTLHLLLEYRYLNHMTWEKIADKMSYDVRWVFRLHKKALAQLEIEDELLKMA